MEARLAELGEIGKTPENGVHRLALSAEDKQAQKLVAGWMKEAGMTVRQDHFGNLIGRKEGTDPQAPVVMLGSHIDSVPNGGRYDGTIGVIGGIEVVQTICEANITHTHPIEVVAFCDEEGPRFYSGLFGSTGMIGKMTQEKLHMPDDEGISRYDELRSMGLDPDNQQDSVRKPGEIKVYLEMHIEQGPYLQAMNAPVGIVTGIAGPAWLNIKLHGMAGHAGTVPMNMRRDPMSGAAEVILAIEKICGSDPSAPTVGTVGKIAAYPGGQNVIPGTVEFSVDIRDTDEGRRDAAISQIQAAVDEVCKRRGLTAEVKVNERAKPTLCSEQVMAAMERAAGALGLTPPKLVSGAGHDAMCLAEIADMGMIFVRCLDGISHNPKEYASQEDITAGTEVLLATTLEYVK
jgi:allantoate deiminase/N-carbamoyl-L-amino-acid hydrolase